MQLERGQSPCLVASFRNIVAQEGYDASSNIILAANDFLGTTYKKYSGQSTLTLGLPTLTGCSASSNESFAVRIWADFNDITARAFRVRQDSPARQDHDVQRPYRSFEHHVETREQRTSENGNGAGIMAGESTIEGEVDLAFANRQLGFHFKHRAWLYRPSSKSHYWYRSLGLPSAKSFQNRGNAMRSDVLDCYSKAPASVTYMNPMSSILCGLRPAPENNNE
ncbi:hypothetical protein BS47DRAFT_1390796 [Hydnum rufescens UP504]|uniref:Uncharacterized protein n=1 Tax=Hydnum rufescens UP504 TaxID=1448309 RepID=A0A9P6DZ45_9AGAM|nr:hypothetical protein BS47DRAFT_1390796 [Hydnum rufescens UP504]